MAGELTVNYAERRVSLAGRPVQLTDTEYRMLLDLSANAGRVLGHAELLQRVWGPAHSGRIGAVRSVIRNLRSKLGDSADNPTYIHLQPAPCRLQIANGEAQPETVEPDAKCRQLQVLRIGSKERDELTFISGERDAYT